MRVAILIPARLASSRLPNKPLADIDGAPMIVQVYRRALQSGAGEVVVACDGPEIAQAIEAEGGKAIITDPELPSGSDRIYAAYKKLGAKFDVIVNLQGDLPTLDPDLIQEVLKPLAKPEVDIATLAAPITEASEISDPSVVKVARAESGKALYFSREAIPHNAATYYHHIGIYAYKVAALEAFVALPPSPLESQEKLEQLRALEAGMHIEVSLVDTVPLGVDTQETLDKAREFYA